MTGSAPHGAQEPQEPHEQPRTWALTQALDAALPQTQCTRCGYPDCRAYAQAMAQGEADINRCPPGGAEGVERLAAITGLAAKPLNPANGLEGVRTVAVIDEAWCIGCTLCIKACPVDCIVGASKVMHTVVEADCTGCELCIPVCPVDCITLAPVSGTATGWQAWGPALADAARTRYAWHQDRTARDRAENTERLAAHAQDKLTALEQASGQPGGASDTRAADAKRAVIQAAMDRARAQRLGVAASPPASDKPTP